MVVMVHHCCSLAAVNFSFIRSLICHAVISLSIRHAVSVALSDFVYFSLFLIDRLLGSSPLFIVTKSISVHPERSVSRMASSSPNNPRKATLRLPTFKTDVEPWKPLTVSACACRPVKYT